MGIVLSVTYHDILDCFVSDILRYMGIVLSVTYIRSRYMGIFLSLVYRESYLFFASVFKVMMLRVSTKEMVSQK